MPGERKASLSNEGIDKHKAVNPTLFQMRVYDACRCIPPGKVSTYGSLATALKSSARAVGNALRRNPYAPVVPCHRVIASTLEIGGFSGSWGAETANCKRKRSILEGEGVFFDARGKLQHSSTTLLTSEQLLDRMNKIRKVSN